jgi:hypothetical protein
LWRDTIFAEQDGMIEDLDVIVERRPTLRERWLLPALGAIALVAVLLSTFAQLAPLHASVFQGAPARVSVLRPTGPANGFKALELPRTIATVASRTQFSGVTGLTPTALSDGFRDVYRFADGRALFVIEYPDLTNGALMTPGGSPVRDVVVRRANGRAYATESATMPLIVGWVADGMQYQVGGAGFTTAELLQFAEALR